MDIYLYASIILVGARRGGQVTWCDSTHIKKRLALFFSSLTTTPPWLNLTHLQRLMIHDSNPGRGPHQ